jgi:microcompartment protein CcmK/EutM
LDECNGATLWGSHFPVLSRTSPELGKEGTQEGAKHFAREFRVVRTAITERVWKREHPLADRDFGQNAVDEVCRGIGHAVAAATGAKAPAFARKGDEAIEAAIVAVQAQEAMGEDAASQEGVELLLDEAGHGLFASLRARQEGPEFLLDDVVEVLSSG